MKIAADKWKHFYAGIVLGIILHAAILYFLQLTPALSALLAFAAVVLISYGFELFSLITGWGHYDVMDAVASAIGGLPGIAVCWLF